MGFQKLLEPHFFTFLKTRKMKKLHLLVIALFVCGTSFAQNFPVDFETGGNGANWTWTTFENDDNPALEIVANPSSTGINTSSTVAKFTARQTGNPWAGCESLHGTDIGNYQISATNSTIKIMVYKSVISDVGIKLVTASGWAKPELKVANTKINEWEELSFDFSTVDHEGMTYDQIVVFMDYNLAGRAADTESYFDNITFGAGGGGGNDNEPMTAAPTPTVPASNVISIYSDVYDDPTDVDYYPNWGQTTQFSVFNIGSDGTLKYSNLNYQGVNFGADGASIDLSDMNKMHIDIWTSGLDNLDIFLINPGPVEHKITPTLTKGSWTSIDVELTDFTSQGISLSNVFQMKLENQANAGGTIFIDNLYFYKDEVNSVKGSTLSRFRAYPNPTIGNVTLPSTTVSFTVTNISGQQVLNGLSNLANLAELTTGIYTINAVLQDGTTVYSKVSKQ